MTLYTDLQATASSLLASYGQAVTFTRSSKATFVPGTGVTKTDTTYTASLIVDNYSAVEIDGSAVQAGDMKVISYSSTAPAIDDTATVNGTKYRIMQVNPISPAGTVVAYELQFRS